MAEGQGRNNVVNDMHLLWPKYVRQVTWISPELYIPDSAEGMDRLMIHLAGMMGMRCEEILNLKSERDSGIRGCVSTAKGTWDPSSRQHAVPDL